MLQQPAHAQHVQAVQCCIMPLMRLRVHMWQNKNTEFCAPLTSFDWNETDPSIIGTSSIDTTCTIWDLNKMQVLCTQQAELPSVGPHLS